MEIRSHYYNYYNVKGRYTPETKQEAGWVKRYEQTDDKIEGNNSNKDSEVYQAYVKLESIYYEQGVKNRARYSTYDELQTALSQKYLFNNSVYAGKYTYEQRQAMYANELSMSAFGYCSNFNDPLLGGPVHADTDDETQAYNRKSVNNQINNILQNGGIDVDKFSEYDVKLMIEPYDYRLTLLGIEDDDLKKKAEDLLNQNGNSKELFFHILNSLQNNSSGLFEDVMAKYRVTKELQNTAGLDFRDFVSTEEGFVNADGENILDVYKNALIDTDTVPAKYKSAAYEIFEGYISKLAGKDVNSISDLELTIGFSGGSLYDMPNEKAARYTVDCYA